MTDSNSTNNSFIPVLLLLVSATVIIATFYESEAKKAVANAEADQTETIAVLDEKTAEQTDTVQNDSNQAVSIAVEVETNQTTAQDTTEKTPAASSTANTEAATTEVATANVTTDNVATDNKTTITETSEVNIAQADTSTITEGSGNNSANGSADQTSMAANSNQATQSNAQNTVATAEVNTSAETATIEQTNTDINVAQNTVSHNVATQPTVTQQTTARHMPMPPRAPNTMRNAMQAHPRNMPVANANRYAPRQQPRQNSMSMAQHKEAAMAYQAEMEQRRHAMMKAMEARRLENNARIETQLRNQAKFLAEMKQMQKMAFQRAEENRRLTRVKIQEINQRYQQLRNQINKMNSSAEAPTTDSTVETPAQ